jgi:hypothetical protein
MALITKHADAQDAVRSALLGCEVRFGEFQRNAVNHERAPRMCRYEIVVPSLSRWMGPVQGSYELPEDPEKIMRDARERVRSATIEHETNECQ